MKRFVVANEEGANLFEVERLELPLPGDRLVIVGRGAYQVLPGRIIGLDRGRLELTGPYRPVDATIIVKELGEGE